MTASAAAAQIPAPAQGQMTVMPPVLVVEEGLGPLQDVGGAEVLVEAEVALRDPQEVEFTN